MVRIDKINNSYVFTIADDKGTDSPVIHAIGKKGYPTIDACLEGIRELFINMGQSITHEGTSTGVRVYDSIEENWHDVDLSPELENHETEYEQRT